MDFLLGQPSADLSLKLHAKPTAGGMMPTVSVAFGVQQLTVSINWGGPVSGCPCTESPSVRAPNVRASKS